MMDLKHLVSGGLRIALSHTATLTQPSGRICENNQAMENCLHDYCVCVCDQWRQGRQTRAWLLIG